MQTLDIWSVKLACLAILCMPFYALAGDILDLQLGVRGLLEGRLLDGHGEPIKGGDVTIWQGSNQVVRTVADRGGFFRVRGLRGGNYELQSSGGNHRMYRFWSANTAPPTAPSSLTLVADVEGQAKKEKGKPIDAILRKCVLHPRHPRDKLPADCAFE